MQEDGQKESLPLVTQEVIEEGLSRLGLTKGSLVEVHSSLGSFGKVEGGAGAVINALTNIVGSEGTIVMSAYPLTAPVPLSEEEKSRGIAWKTKVIAEDSAERTGMGIIVDEFKVRPDVACGHGIHRVCAWGKDKERYLDGYARLVENDGWVLLAGVGIDRCSSMHLAEEIPVPKEISAYDEVPEDIKKDYPSEQWGIGVGSGTPADGWQKVYRKADEQGLVKHVRIGNAECHLFKAKDLLEILKDWRSNDPFGLYGVPKP